MRTRLLIPIATAILAVMILPSTVSAHARLKSSTPVVGEVLQAAPTQVVITFTQEIQKVSGNYSIRVNRDRGQDVTAAPAVVDDTDRHTMSVQLQPDLVAGRYVVNWHNVSDEDGDPLDGAFSFYLQTQPNAVDLANDAQLAQIGAPETPSADTSATSETPAASAPAGGATSPPATSAATTQQPAVTATASSSGSSSSGGSNTTVYVIIAVLAVATVGAAGAWWVFTRRPA
jgi:methionine-rich copper-binding protein CopC